jgi:hypothetical protein
METSILISTKKILGLDQSYTAFDQDVLTHINTAFSTLNQLGVGPVQGFFIEDETPTWDDFLDMVDDVMMHNMVKTYVYLRVRLLFDPPQTSYLIEALNQQLKEFEWRLNVEREGEFWVDPRPPINPYDEAA